MVGQGLNGVTSDSATGSRVCRGVAAGRWKSEERDHSGLRAGESTAEAALGLEKMLSPPTTIALRRFQKLRTVWSTKPLMVASLLLAAARMRLDSCAEHQMSMVVLGPGGRRESATFNP